MKRFYCTNNRYVHGLLNYIIIITTIVLNRQFRKTISPLSNIGTIVCCKGPANAERVYLNDYGLVNFDGCSHVF